MNAIQLLRDQLKSAHEIQENTVGEISEKEAQFNDVGKAIPVGAAYAHSVIGEDMVVAQMLAHTTPLSKGNLHTGLSEPMPSFAEWSKHEEWVKTVKVDISKLREFAKKVYKATDEYIATLTEADLDKELDIPGMGKHTIVNILSNFVILHTANLTGEISAIKGVQGLKGYPF